MSYSTFSQLLAVNNDAKQGHGTLPALASPATGLPLGGWHLERSGRCLSGTGWTSYWDLSGGSCSFHLSIQNETKGHLCKTQTSQINDTLGFSDIGEI